MELTDGWVSQEYENLAHVLYDYDPNLRLEMVPRSEWDHLIDKTKIFRVVDIARNNIVMYFSVIASPTDILEKIWSMDQTYNKVVINLDARNAAAKALQMNKHAEEMEAKKDFVLFLAKNTKSRWTHEGRVRDEHFRDLGPVKTVID